MKVGEVVGHKPDPFLYEKDSDTWVSPSLRIGVEVEVENPNRQGISNTELQPFWEFETDGSLRDHGFEIVLSKPLFGKDLTKSLSLMETFMSKYKLVLNYRTGLHIHMDSREMELAELERFLIIYALFEESLFNFVGDNRNNNNFCAPWSRISDHLANVFLIFSGDITQDDVRENIDRVERYSALNCNALNKFGSLEFRHMQMTRDFTKIRKWINLIMSMHNASLKEAPWGASLDKDVFIREVSKGGATFVAKKIFPDWFLPLVDDAAIWRGVLLVQDITSNQQTKAKFGEFSLLNICPTKGLNKGLEIFMTKGTS